MAPGDVAEAEGREAGFRVKGNLKVTYDFHKVNRGCWGAEAILVRRLSGGTRPGEVTTLQDVSGRMLTFCQQGPPNVTHPLASAPPGWKSSQALVKPVFTAAFAPDIGRRRSIRMHKVFGIIFAIAATPLRKSVLSLVTKAVPTVWQGRLGDGPEQKQPHRPA